ncbi:4Fe-4S binding domain-containing protein [Treponema bryantii]|uniref:4Fe-4S binding domain-containing protein n=1 Tax=Treponema bryantii TaxID=163 RepID=A0A1H9EFH9_9SPIR|nr:4Fe-4S binding protein [Treponema bryantii]SEQ24385.1 4Fe-4S binding domain-containing protein [Treponema bryantii]
MKKRNSAELRREPNKIRLLIQLAFTAISNGYIKGFAKGQIFTGATKYLCVPGMNCYSCPGALGSCPIGALQATLNARQYKMSLYVLGLMTVFGTLLGRFVCGFLCPFGLIQDLLFKIPFVKKIRRLPGEKGLRWLRFVFLGIFVILLPLFVIDITGLGEPWFCKWICPVGTLEGGIPLVLLNNAMRGAAGFLFRWKLVILAVTLLSSIIIYRPFCRYVCPLGAVYGLFNKISLYRIKIDSQKCTGCNTCQKACHLDIPVWKNPDSMDCIRCGECKTACPHGAISTTVLK